ncbi:non-homologous end-joining DNA ligase [Angustibacter sp. McL0619]|uniref:non-homologous end-joining DNA ligase n=1 Tax=Angustibacter sp. McL0619 TaxID=3415676 RepID=UPI003CEBC67B
MSPDDVHQAQVEIDGRRLRLSNLDKVLYPQAGTTKADIIDYYARISAVMLPLLADRPVSRFRWPNGVAAPSFVEKAMPMGSPDWVSRVTLDVPGSTKKRDLITYPVVDGLPTLVWLANLAALELHVPQWTVGPRGGRHDPDRLVVDLDPGAPAGLAECAEVALLVRERLAGDGLECVPVTSGSKGLQLYAPLSGEQDADVVREYARRLAESLAAEHRSLVVSSMSKALRPRKILLDWSQNHHAKTTICPYSLRGRDQPNAAAPRTWDEIEDGGSLKQLSYQQVLDRMDDLAPVTAALLDPGPRVPTS